MRPTRAFPVRANRCISSELEEVLRASHRIAVMREHKMVAEFTDESGDEIMHAIAGSTQ